MKIEIYKDSRGEWRWRLRSRNGKIVADCGEGYKTKSSVKKAVIRFVEAKLSWLDAFVRLEAEEKKRAPKNP